MAPLAVIIAATLGLHAIPSSAHEVDGREGYGFIGYGISMYSPPCAYACRASVPNPLECPHDHGHMDGSEGGSHSSETSPECYATNEHFLRTVAWCIHSRCENVTMADIEKYWELNIPGRGRVQPLPRLSFQEALSEVSSPPAEPAAPEEILNFTAVVPDETYLGQYDTLTNFEEAEVSHSRYGLVVFLSGIVIPIGFSLVRLLPFPKSWISTFYASVIDPPAIGTRHAVPAMGLAVIPTRGQALFLLYLVTINVVLSAVSIRTNARNLWFSTPSWQVLAYLSNRVGVLSLANLALTILYGGRNNVLLRLTNWSHTTFLLVHRWAGFLCMLQAVLHSLIYLAKYVVEGTHGEESKLPYWYTGIVGTLAVSLMVPLAILPIRRRAYEIFVDTHLLFAVAAILGCWYHIVYRFGHQWGYETWIYTAIAVLSFDHVARVLRVLRTGVKRAHVTAIDREYYRIEIPGVAARGHVYVFFPTLSWRPWENHPFSVAASTVSGDESPALPVPNGSPVLVGENDKEIATVSSSPPSSISSGRRVAGITLYMRAQGGCTSHIAAQAGRGGIPVLVEGSYGGEADAFFTQIRQTREYPNILCIAGGVGISAILPVLQGAQSITPGSGFVKLYWGSRSRALVEAVSSTMNPVVDVAAGEMRWGDAVVSVSIGERMALREILESELSHEKGGTTVVVCGPGSMADEVRCTVAAIGRHGNVVVRLVEKSFHW